MTPPPARPNSPIAPADKARCRIPAITPARSERVASRPRRAALWYMSLAGRAESRFGAFPPMQALRPPARLRHACAARIVRRAARPRAGLALPAQARREASLRHRHARRAGAARRLSPRMPYVNPDAPKGGRLVEGVLGTFDSLNPLIVQGLAGAADPRLRGRKPDGARLRRAVHALRSAGAHGRDRRRARATSPSRSIRRRIFPTARR